MVHEEKNWWNFLPSRSELSSLVGLIDSEFFSIALRIRDELLLLTNKNAGVSADAFDIILTMWSHIKRYRESLFFVLEVFLSFSSHRITLEGIVSLFNWLRWLPNRSRVPYFTLANT